MNCASRQFDSNKLCPERVRINQLFKRDKTRVRTEHDGLTKHIIRKLHICTPKDDVSKRRTAHANLTIVVLPLDRIPPIGRLDNSGLAHLNQQPKHKGVFTLSGVWLTG